MMLETVKHANTPRLDYAKIHDPLVSIIITHFNYSDHIRDALLSVISQTHQNWECVIVDDGSTPEHRQEVERIVATIGSEKIRLLSSKNNMGQVHAFFAGVDTTSGAFVSLLDPDDRYTPTFIEEALAAHLNGAIFCPMVSTDQYLLSGNSIITGCYSFNTMKASLLKAERVGNATVVPSTIEPRLLYFPAEVSGWHWSTTSAIMFRRGALHYLRPHKRLSYNGSVDAYLANGGHLLGGSLFLTKPLIYRSVHSGNSWLTPHIYSIEQVLRKAGGADNNDTCIADVVEAILHNSKRVPFSSRIEREYRPSTSRRLHRSIRERWRRLIGKLDSKRL